MKSLYISSGTETANDFNCPKRIMRVVKIFRRVFHNQYIYKSLVIKDPPYVLVMKDPPGLKRQFANVCRLYMQRVQRFSLAI